MEFPEGVTWLYNDFYYYKTLSILMLILGITVAILLISVIVRFIIIIANGEFYKNDLFIIPIILALGVISFTSIKFAKTNMNNYIEYYVVEFEEDAKYLNVINTYDIVDHLGGNIYKIRRKSK